jgi:hypothetical protein
MTHRSAIAEAESLLGRSRMSSLLFEMVVNRLPGRPARVLCAVRATALGGSLESVAVAETWEVVLDKLAASLAEGKIDYKIQMAREVSHGMREQLEGMYGPQPDELPDGI